MTAAEAAVGADLDARPPAWALCVAAPPRLTALLARPDTVLLLPYLHACLQAEAMELTVLRALQWRLGPVFDLGPALGPY